MWIAHLAPRLAAKPFAPGIPQVVAARICRGTSRFLLSLLVLYVLVAKRKVSVKDGAVLLAVTLNIKITPRTSDPECSTIQLHCFYALFLGGLWVYTTFAPIATRVGYKRHPARLWGVALILLVQQAHFCFGVASTMETRWLHAPTCLSEILFDILLIGKLEA
ncbi:hypothetical protein BDR03DRAFT_989305 [Suillus americanus]|nr:hypothetical protein BDR03DRAFT_989305 [Suillus americanus]